MNDRELFCNLHLHSIRCMLLVDDAVILLSLLCFCFSVQSPATPHPMVYTLTLYPNIRIQFECNEFALFFNATLVPLFLVIWSHRIPYFSISTLSLIILY